MKKSGNFKKLVLGTFVVCLKLIVIVMFVFNDKGHQTQSKSPVRIRNFNVSSTEKGSLHVEPQMSAGVALFDRRICSGLGDRLLAIFSAYTIAVLNNKTLVARWCEVSDRSDRTYPLAALQTHVKLPNGIKLLADDHFDRYQSEIAAEDAKIDYQGQELEALHGYDGVPSLAFRTMGLKGGVPIHRQPFEDAYYRWTKQIQCGAMCTLPGNSSYLVLHIRQGDKTFEHGSQPFVPGVPNAKYCTHEAIRNWGSRGVPMYIVSDDSELKQIVAGAYAGVMQSAIESPNSQVFCDLCLMMNSRGIIQHSPMGWSALSAVAAFAAEIPILSTWYGTSPNGGDPMFNRMHDFEAKGGRPKLTLDCLDLNRLTVT